jgi:hypothetical protein
MVYADFALFGLRMVYAWFTQISHGLRMVYADFLGLRKFTRVNLMTQVYNGSPSQGHSGPGPAFVAAAPAVAAHPGPEQHGARLDRPGRRHRHLRRRGASRAGAARCPAGPTGAPSRRIPGGWPGPAFVAAARRRGASRAGAARGRPVRPGLIAGQS